MGATKVETSQQKIIHHHLT